MKVLSGPRRPPQVAAKPPARKKPEGAGLAREHKAIVQVEVPPAIYYAAKATSIAGPPTVLAGGMMWALMAVGGVYQDTYYTGQLLNELCEIQQEYPSADEICMDPNDPNCDYRLYQSGAKWILWQSRVDHVCGRPKHPATVRFEEATAASKTCSAS